MMRKKSMKIFKMKKICALLVLFGCKTHTVRDEKHTEIQATSQTQTRQEESSVANLMVKQEDYHLGVKNFNYNFTLKSQDSTQPARIMEYRNGKPYREIIAKNAIYTEQKVEKDSTNHWQIKELLSDIQQLQTQLNAYRRQAESTQNEVVKIKTDKVDLLNNFKLLLWTLMLFGIAWIGYTSGALDLIKRFLKNI